MLNPDLLSRRLAREKKARKEAEIIADTKSRVLYQTNLDLIDKEKKTHAILEATADGILVLNDNFEIQVANNRACQIFECEPEKLNGKKISTLINNISQEKLHDALSRVLENENTNVLYEIVGLTQNKNIIPIELAISKMQLTQETAIICAIRDISERKRLEERLAVRHEIIRLMAEHFSLDEVTPKILQIICEKMHLEYGGLWKLDKKNNVLRCVDVWRKKGKKLKEFAKISSEFVFSSGIGLPGRVWKNKQSCWIEDATKDNNFPRLKWAMAAGLHGAFAFPILFENELVGVLEFFTKSYYQWDNTLISMLNDITYQLGIFIDRENAQKKISSLSRLAGMAEVASDVLHNVGNTLNSINTSVAITKEKIVKSKMDNLIPLSNLLNEHRDNLAQFLQSQKGEQLLTFITMLSEKWYKEKSNLLEELSTLEKNVTHIKHIILTQQSLSRAINLTEEVSLPELIDDALALNKTASEMINATIIKDFSPIKRVIIDRVKLFQILVNLIKNAIEALSEISSTKKNLRIKVAPKDHLNFMIQVIDDGIGFNTQNNKKIFSHGYTTKKSGHGFGLHSSANFAQEMGGSLSAESLGENKGAVFTLILPFKPTHLKHI